MKTTYELWDYETSNLVDAYETEQAALDDIVQTISTEGHEAIATLALLRDDPLSPAKIVVATGADLAKYAMQARLKAKANA